MPTPTSVSRRIEATAIHAKKDCFEEALINLFPAIDKTAQKRRPKEKVGKRITSFLEDQQEIITLVATHNSIQLSYNGLSMAEAIYKFARNPLIHEGELDPMISFNNQEGLIIGDKWNLPPSYILGLTVGVIVSKENSDEYIDNSLGCKLWNYNYRFNELWGHPELVRKAIQEYATPLYFR